MELQQNLARFLKDMDQPSVDGINTWLISKAANEIGLKVALSGLGGDELFGGYPSFRDLPRWTKLFVLPAQIPGLGPATRKLGEVILNAAGSLASVSPKAPGYARIRCQSRRRIPPSSRHFHALGTAQDAGTRCGGSCP